MMGVQSATVKTFIRKKHVLCALLILGIVANIYMFRNHRLRVVADNKSAFDIVSPGPGRSEVEESHFATFHNETWLKKRTKLLSAKLPTKLFLFAHMRGGSSIAGEIFNTDPRATMWYEPGDAFFCSYYGLQHENLPQNDLYSRNMTRRILDTQEQRAMTNFYTNMLTCQYRRLPPEAMGHYFLGESTAMDKFVACTGKRRSNINRCVGHIIKICSAKFVEISRSKHCHIIIQSTREVMERHRNSGENVALSLIKASLNNGIDVSTEDIRKFVKHESCLQIIRKDNEKCMDRAIKKCTSDHLQVLQVNRMKMEELEPIIEANPDIYVIYYTRDPRAIALSRVSYSNLLWNKKDRRPVSEARILCHKMAEDIRQLKILQDKYPGIFLHIKYEDLVTDPINTAQRMYALFGKTAPPGWSTYAQKTMFAKSSGRHSGFGITVKNATENALKWTKEYPKDQMKETQKLCEDYLRTVGYPILEL